MLWGGRTHRVLRRRSSAPRRSQEGQGFLNEPSFVFSYRVSVCNMRCARCGTVSASLPLAAPAHAPAGLRSRALHTACPLPCRHLLHRDEPIQVLGRAWSIKVCLAALILSVSLACAWTPSPTTNVLSTGLIIARTHQLPAPPWSSMLS